LFIFILLECGKLLSVGYNQYGCIGDGTTNICQTIKEIDYFSNIFIVDVICGCYHCLSISNLGEIFSWGYNILGQIGNGKSGNNNKIQNTPIKIFKI
jgi:alpha-tubulin suppressor-like RCC1 family protein